MSECVSARGRASDWRARERAAAAAGRERVGTKSAGVGGGGRASRRADPREGREKVGERAWTRGLAAGAGGEEKGGGSPASRPLPLLSGLPAARACFEAAARRAGEGGAGGQVSGRPREATAGPGAEAGVRPRAGGFGRRPGAGGGRAGGRRRPVVAGYPSRRGSVAEAGSRLRAGGGREAAIAP